MMRQVVSMVGGIVIALYALFFIVPLLSSTKTGEASLFNQTDPTIALSNTLGTGFYSAIWFIPIIAGAFLLISFALRRDAFE